MRIYWDACSVRQRPKARQQMRDLDPSQDVGARGFSGGGSLRTVKSLRAYDLRFRSVDPHIHGRRCKAYTRGRLLRAVAVTNETVRHRKPGDEMQCPSRPPPLGRSRTDGTRDVPGVGRWVSKGNGHQSVEPRTSFARCSVHAMTPRTVSQSEKLSDTSEHRREYTSEYQRRPIKRGS